MMRAAPRLSRLPATRRAASSVSRRAASSAAVAFDVDGVLVRGGATVPAAPGALKALEAAGIPFLFMTNGGGTEEGARAAGFAKRFGVAVEPWQVCQSHTPMRALAEKHGDENVLLVGKKYGNLREIAEAYGFRSAVTVEAFHAAFPLLYPDAPPVAGAAPPPDGWLERPFGAVLAMTDPLLWGRELQVVCDVLRSGGVPAGDLGAGAPPAASQNVPLYSSCADFLYAAEHPAPRFGSGAFLTALDATFAELAGSALAKVDYGKPHAVSYDYVAAVLGERAGGLDRVFMVGDNPLTDIAGAKRAGDPWSSILVESGMWRPGDDTGGADAVVADVAAAVDVVLAFERG
jgi:HAD superfamily hydrolase (TIGR01456 family)